MIRPETARQLKEAGLTWRPKTGDAFMPEEGFGEEVFITDGGRDPEPGDVWLPDVETMVREINARGWCLRVLVCSMCHLRVFDWDNNVAYLTGPAGDFADLVGRALLFVLNTERGKDNDLRTGPRRGCQPGRSNGQN